jgi:hypothetical protein
MPGSRRIVTDPPQDVQRLVDERTQREQVEVLVGVDEPGAGRRLPHELDPARQVHQAAEQDRDRGHRQPQQQRHPLDRGHLVTSGLGQPVGGSRGLVERGTRRLADDRKPGERAARVTHRVRQPGRRLGHLASGAGELHGDVVSCRPRPDPARDPEQEQQVAEQLPEKVGGGGGIELHGAIAPQGCGYSRRSGQ